MEILNNKTTSTQTEKKQTQECTVNLINRKELTLTGVSKVKSTTESAIVAVVGGNIFTVAGSGLEVRVLNLESGTMQIAGLIDTMKFSGAASTEKKNIIKKIFG